MMQRDEWLFTFPAEKLAEAAAKKKTHYAGRRKFWEDAKEKVMAEDVWCELANAGAYSCAQKLRNIARTGECKGSFSGKMIQEAAEAILVL